MLLESGDLNPGVTREVGSQHDSVLELLREAIDSAVDESDRWSVVLDRRPLDVCSSAAAPGDHQDGQSARLPAKG